MSFIESASGKHLNAPHYDLKMFPDLSGGVFNKIAKLMVREQDPFTYAVDTLYTSLTTQTVTEGFAKQQGRRAKGKIIYEILSSEETNKN